MQADKIMKRIITGLFVITFIFALNMQVSIYNNSPLDQNNISNFMENDLQQIEDISINRINTRFKFNTTGVDFSNNNPFYFGFLGINQETITNLTAIAEDEYRFWNISLLEGYYATVEAFFIVDPPKNRGDFDMDIFYPNGTMWQYVESRDHNEIIGPTLIPVSGDFIVVLYPYAPDLPVYTPVGNTIDKIRVIMEDLPTLVDNDVNYDYYGSKENIYSPVLGSGATDIFDFRSKTKVTVTYGYENTGYDVTLTLTNLASEVLLNTTNNGTFFFFTDNPDTFTVLMGTSSPASVPTLLNVTYQPYEDTLSRTHEVFPDNYDFLWESQPFNPDDYQNDYTSDIFGTAVSSHLENFKIFLYDGQALYLNVSWTADILRDVDDVAVRLFNYDDAITGNYVKTPGSNNYAVVAGYVIDTYLKFVVSGTGWYIIQVGNRALDSAITGWHEYNMDIVVNDKYDVEPPYNDVPGNALGLSPNDQRYGLTDNSTTPNNDDYYRVPVVAESRFVVDVEFQYYRGVVNLYILNSTLDIVGTSIFDQQNQQHIEVLVFSDESFFILVNSTSSYDNYYNLFVNVYPIDDSYEPNDNAGQAQQLPGDGVYDLFLAKDNLDWFFISLFKDDDATIELDFIGSLADLNLFVYNSNGQSVGSSTSGTGDHEEVVFVAPSTDIYLIRVRGVSATFIQPGLDYQLTISVVENDDDLEPNDSSGSARPLQDGNFPELKVRAGDED
ncbi:MAG: hypothetical protein ACW99A_22250, partial [Candidatus Kariarchaeaceae archaeon]